MSATDSDASIDWLASDNDDIESEQEPDCTREHSQTARPPSPSAPPHLSPSDSCCHRNAAATEGDDSRSTVSSRGSPSGCAETWHGLCQTKEGKKTNAKNAHEALKRQHSCDEDKRQLIGSVSERERLLTSKCMELQCYIHPLSSILNGLRSGRYRERLSSFQESVAMDRIQRIMGVLQNPCMGEKYMNIILKMEEMLKSWFPNVKLPDQLGVAQTVEAVPPKKLKMSPVTASGSVSTISDPPVGIKSLRFTDLTPPGAYSASNLKWLHTSPICSPTAEHAQAGSRHLLPPKDKDVTQDNAVSSSTDSQIKTHSALRGPPPVGKINAPCLERLLKSTESIISCKGTGRLMDGNWS